MLVERNNILVLRQNMINKCEFNLTFKDSELASEQKPFNLFYNIRQKKEDFIQTQSSVNSLKTKKVTLFKGKQHCIPACKLLSQCSGSAIFFKIEILKVIKLTKVIMKTIK